MLPLLRQAAVHTRRHYRRVHRIDSRHQSAVAPVDPPTVGAGAGAPLRIRIREVSPVDASLWFGAIRAPVSSLVMEGLDLREPRPAGQPLTSWKNQARKKGEGLFAALKKRFGVGVFTQAHQLLIALQQQATSPDWYTQCGLQRSALSQLQLEALHLWLLHTRLRSFESESLVKALFDQFWAAQRETIGQTPPRDTRQSPAATSSPDTCHPTHTTDSAAPAASVPPRVSSSLMPDIAQMVYGMWLAMDLAILPAMRQRDEANDQAVDLATLPSAVFDHPNFDEEAPNRHLLGAIWRNLYAADLTLHPRHVGHLADYVLQTIEHLYDQSDVDLVNGTFTWLAPPIGGLYEDAWSAEERRALQVYFQHLAQPIKHNDTLVTDGVPTFMRRALGTREDTRARNPHRERLDHQRARELREGATTLPAASESTEPW